MKTLLLVIIVLLEVMLSVAFEDATFEDDDFADFEQFDEDVVEDGKEGPKMDTEMPKGFTSKEQSDETNSKAEDELLVEDEGNEFEHFQDPEEFEGFQETIPRDTEQPKITITKVPLMMRPRWDAFWLEGLLCCALAAYALAYIVGRSNNTSIAIDFLKLHKPLLDENFTLVGESGPDAVCAEGEGEGRGGGWRREAEHCFSMWCSGRVNCDGMLLTLKLIKRQDLVHVLAGVVRPASDALLVRVELGRDDADPFVLCVASKKLAARLAKDHHDLSVYCGERRAGDRHGLPATLSVLSECAEAATGLLDVRVQAALAQYHSHVHYIHVSDRYEGPRQMEEVTPSKPPEGERVLVASFALSAGGGPEARQLLQLVLYLVDKIKRLRLSKEALAKCERRRVKAAEAWVRGAHAARQEQAALRREEKRRVEKERILQEDDPEKQRRWELKEQKRQLKRKTPKMKQLKVKAL